jgi:hypothetical protein
MLDQPLNSQCLLRDRLVIDLDGALDQDANSHGELHWAVGDSS